MKKTLITRQQFKVMPWKNGGGVTAEISIDPPESDFRDLKFNWRLSSARIEDENEFSQFPGYDRILTVLSGEGLLLNNEELGPFEGIEFQGEDQIHCAPIGDAVEDLGVIFKRNEFECSMQILDVSAPMYLNLEEGTHFFIALAHPVSLSGTEISPPDFLKTEEAANVEITSKVYPAPVLRVGIRKL